VRLQTTNSYGISYSTVQYTWLVVLVSCVSDYIDTWFCAADCLSSNGLEAASPPYGPSCLVRCLLRIMVRAANYRIARYSTVSIWQLIAKYSRLPSPSCRSQTTPNQTKPQTTTHNPQPKPQPKQTPQRSPLDSFFPLSIVYMRHALH
jgi:hypothetical protein